MDSGVSRELLRVGEHRCELRLSFRCPVNTVVPKVREKTHKKGRSSADIRC